LLEKEFFWKAGPKWIDAQFFFGLKKNFLESPGRGSCVGLFSFFKKAVISGTRCCCRAALGGDFFFKFCLKKNFLQSPGPGSCLGLFSFKKISSN